MQRIFVTAALLLFAAAAARAVNSGYQARRKQLAAEAEAQRAKLNLPEAKLYAQYPTPEISLEGDPPEVACGGSATVKVSARAPKGTAFLLGDDDVQVVDQKATSDGWQARVQVARHAAPRDVNVHAIAPVTGAERSQRALRIRGRYELDLAFEDGWTAHFGAANAGDGDTEGELAWKKGADARTTPARIGWSGDKLRLQWQRSQEEQDATNAAAEKMQGLGGEAVMQKAMGRVQECMKKADTERASCLEAVQQQSDAEMAGLQKKMDAIVAEADQKRPTAAWACGEAQLQAASGALSGTATCAPKDRKMKVTGALRCLGPVSGE